MTIIPEMLSLIDQIKNDRSQGASELARQAVGVLMTAAERSQAGDIDGFLKEQRVLGERLVSARPAMAPVFNIVNRFLGIISAQSQGKDITDIKRLTISEAGRLIQESSNAVARIAGHAAKLIMPGDVIMTHSYSSTVLAALQEAIHKNGHLEVVVTRSGAGQTGIKTAQKLAESGIKITLIDDTAAGLYIGKCRMVMVGADRMCADGALVNGVGTYPVAVLAKRAGKLFYVLCENLKFDPRLKGSEVDLEEKDPSELIRPGLIPAAVKVVNPYFDVTPYELITGVITENSRQGPVMSYFT